MGKSLTTRRSDPPSQNPPPGVRREDVLRDHESVPTPQLMKVKKKLLNAEAVSDCVLSCRFKTTVCETVVLVFH